MFGLYIESYISLVNVHLYLYKHCLQSKPNASLIQYEVLIGKPRLYIIKYRCGTDERNGQEKQRLCIAVKHRDAQTRIPNKTE